MSARAPLAVLAYALVACTAATPTPTPSPTTARPATPAPTPIITASPAPTPSPSPTLSPAPASYVSPRGTITVDQPRAFARVTSPLTVSGSASLFEAAFTWRLVDLAGTELAKGSGQASAGAPARGTFSFSVTFTAARDTYAYLAVISRSPRDGSVDDEARVPVLLAAR